MKSPEQPNGLTKREFLRKVVVGGVVTFVAAGGYVRPELQTLQGPQVAKATGSPKPNKPPYSDDKDSDRDSDKDSYKHKDYDDWKKWLDDLFKWH